MAPSQAIIGARPGTFDLNAIDSRRRGFAEGNGNKEKRASPSSLADGSFSTLAKASERGISVRCWVTMGGKKVRLLIHTLHTSRWPLLIMIVRACRFSLSSSSPLTRGRDVPMPMSSQFSRSWEFRRFQETSSSYDPRVTMPTWPTIWRAEILTKLGRGDMARRSQVRRHVSRAPSGMPPRW